MFNLNPVVPLKESFCYSFLKIDSCGAVFDLKATDAPSPSHIGQCFEMLAHNFHIHTVHRDIIKVFLLTNWGTSELS